MMSSLCRISYYPFPERLLAGSLHYYIFNCAAQIAAHFSQALHVFFAIISSTNYSHENVSQHRIVSVFSRRRMHFHGQLSRISRGQVAATNIYPPSDTGERPSTGHFYFAIRGRIPGWPRAPSASNCIDGCSDSSRPNKIQTASFSPEKTLVIHLK